MPQTKSEIAALLDAAGLAPNQRLGQNFLIDGNLMRRLVAAADLGPADVVLEVGPGTGSLTELLVERAGHVVAVELDRGLYNLLDERIGAADNLTLLHTDVLASKSRTAPEVLDAVRTRCTEPPGRALLVANLPFQIASPLLVDLALSDLPFAAFCFTIQREVAARITAAPHTKDYGPLSIILQAAGRARRIAAVPRQAFWPVPAVESTMLRIELGDDRLARITALRYLNQLVRACFLHRRKTLGYNLRRAFPDAAKALGIGGHCDLTRRPEDLSVEEWTTLAAALSSEGN